MRRTECKTGHEWPARWAIISSRCGGNWTYVTELTLKRSRSANHDSHSNHGAQCADRPNHRPSCLHASSGPVVVECLGCCLEQTACKCIGDYNADVNNLVSRFKKHL